MVEQILFTILKNYDMFGTILLQLLKGAITVEMQNLLEKFREKNGEEKYNQLVTALRANLELLSYVADETKTKIDDKLIDILLESLPTDGSDFSQSFVKEDQQQAENTTQSIEEKSTECKHGKCTQNDAGILICDNCGQEVQ